MFDSDPRTTAGPSAEAIFAIEAHYTALSGLQSACSIRYLLCGAPLHYSIAAVREEDGHCTEVRFALPDIGLEQAKDLVLYCFENAVPLNSLRDVLEDLCFS